MTTFTDILLRYEAGELTRPQAVEELVRFGISKEDAEKALGIAEAETHGAYGLMGGLKAAPRSRKWVVN